MPVASKYKIYSDMKDSNISWLCEVPAHWQLYKFKNIFRIRKRIAGKLGFDILSITQKGIKIKDTESGDGQLSMDYSKYQLVFENDFAMNHMDLLTGYVDLSKHEGVTSPDYRVFTLEAKNCNRKYFLYLLQLCYVAKIFYPLGQGAANIGRWRLPTDAFNEFVAPKPPHDEQIRIANFLEHETAKIDTLIEKQQQLIQLLKEKRQAVIRHAVTKGLNPNAKMKDSGVEWLGEVPEHWKVSQIKWYANIKSGENFLSNDIESTKDEDFCYPVYGGNGILGYIKEFNLKNAAIVIGRVGALCGNVHGVMGLSWISDNALILNINFSVFSFDYIYLCLSARDLNTLADKNAQPLITGSKVMNEYVPIPPIDEQHKIAGQVAEMKKQFEMLSAQAELGITLLQERRTALISAAVTGKIDVRNWQEPKDSQPNMEVVT